MSRNEDGLFSNQAGRDVRAERLLKEKDALIRRLRKDKERLDDLLAAGVVGSGGYHELVVRSRKAADRLIRQWKAARK